MRIRATVRKVTGSTKHLQGVRIAGTLELATVPDPKTVEITEQEGAVFLLRFDHDHECIADTWHETVEAAKEQANFEFGIENGDWEDMEPQH